MKRSEFHRRTIREIDQKIPWRDPSCLFFEFHASGNLQLRGNLQLILIRVEQAADRTLLQHKFISFTTLLRDHF